MATSAVNQSDSSTGPSPAQSSQRASAYEIVTAQVIKQIENGVAPWRKPWRTESPVNLISQKAYRGLNVFMLATQGYESRFWLTFNHPGSFLARGMYLTVTYSEGVRFISSSEIASEAKGTFVGERRVRAHMAACKDWPRGDVPASFIEPVKSDIPIIMFSGEVDGSSPPWFGQDAVRYMHNGIQILARYYGHQLDSPCL